MADSFEQQQYQPQTTIEIDCSTSAKGDVNVSWRVKIQMPSVDAIGSGPVVAGAPITMRAELLCREASEIAARAKERYLIDLQIAALEVKQAQEQQLADLLPDFAEVDGSYPADRVQEIERPINSAGIEYPGVLGEVN